MSDDELEELFLQRRPQVFKNFKTTVPIPFFAWCPWGGRCSAQAHGMEFFKHPMKFRSGDTLVVKGTIGTAMNFIHFDADVLCTPNYHAPNMWVVHWEQKSGRVWRTPLSKLPCQWESGPFSLSPSATIRK